MFLGLLISDISNFMGASGTSAAHMEHNSWEFKPSLGPVSWRWVLYHVQTRLTQYGEEGGGVLLVQTSSGDARVESVVTQVYIHDPQHTTVHHVPEIVME